MYGNNKIITIYIYHFTTRLHLKPKTISIRTSNTKRFLFFIHSSYKTSIISPSTLPKMQTVTALISSWYVFQLYRVSWCLRHHSDLPSSKSCLNLLQQETTFWSFIFRIHKQQLISLWKYNGCSDIKFINNSASNTN